MTLASLSVRRQNCSPFDNKAMVAGLAFLSKKSFNPKNLSNQKTVWEARQQKKQQEKRIQERETQLKREREDEELARARLGATGGDKATLSFMYAIPPSVGDQVSNVKDSCQSSVARDNAWERQPGDDDAAAAFRAMLAGASTPQEESIEKDRISFSNSSGAALQGPKVDRTLPEVDGRSALEKAVGRKDRSNVALTLEEQIARFPQLQHAPMAKGMKGTDVQVNFKPLGTQLRNVQCLVCGVWGHSKGDRECTMSGWDPFSLKVPNVPIVNAVSNDIKEDFVGINPIAQAGKRHQSHVHLDSDSSDDYRARKERKRRRKEQKRQRESSPSLDGPLEKHRNAEDRAQYERRKERKKSKKKKKYSRVYSDSD